MYPWRDNLQWINILFKQQILIKMSNFKVSLQSQILNICRFSENIGVIVLSSLKQH